MTTQTPSLSPAQILSAQNQANAIANSVPSSVVGGNEFVFFAAFDGTNNGANPPADGSGDSQTTAVNQLFTQVSQSGNVGGAYEPGVGTTGSLPFSSAWDVTVTAQSVTNAQNAYKAFAAQATAWLAIPAHSGGSLTSMITSFSRGGAAAAIFAQMLYEYGLVNSAGQVLIQPGTVGAVSAALIIDPVLTGVDGNVEFPPNVQNLTVVRAQNEYRTDFEAANYTGDNATVLPVLGNHGDAGDLYDNGLGGIYLDAYTQFFRKAGLSIASVPSSRTYDQTKPVVVHSESLTAAQILLDPTDFYDATYNSLAITNPAYLTVARKVVNYGTNGQPVAVTGSATSFTTDSGDIVIGGTGYTISIDSTSLVLLPGSSASIGGVGDTITVNQGATLDFTSARAFVNESIKLTQNSKVIIDTPFAFRGTIDGFAASDTIDLAGIGTATGATLGANNLLNVTGPPGHATVTIQLDPNQNYTNYNFVATADGHGGTDIVITAVTTLATFTGTSGATPGADPKGGLIEDSAGNLYGTTPLGGASNDGNDGTVFEIPKTATGYGTLKTLASFSNNFGEGPPAGLVADSAGDLFGTTYGGGANYAGAVFEIAKGATAPTILASFNAGAASTTTGSGPEAGLIMDSAGDLFGTTTYGGASAIDGAVFEIPKAAVGYGPLTLLASFNFTNGAVPRAGLTIDSAGNLFGTTSQGGAFSDGTVFEIAKGANTPTTLVNFNGTDGSGPLAGLITDSAGDLFGTTFSGGPPGTAAGTVFEIKKTGSGYASTPTTLVSFPSATAGDEPMGSLIMDAAGDLFGTTSAGGLNGAGTVFEIKTANTATGYASAPILVSNAFNFSGYGGTLLADRTTGNLFVPSGGGVGYGTEVEITNSGFVTTAPTATAAAATSPVATTVAAGSTLSVTSTESIPNLLDDGTVAIASGGSLDVSSAVDPSSSGIFQLAGNASLEIASILGTSLKIQFLGSSPTNELTIDSAANFGTQVGTASYAGPLLESFTAGDIIDLKGIASAGLGLAYSAASGDLQITGSSGSALATLAFQNSTLGAGTFHTASDGVGGTLITHS